jgi:excisionase family DNA binding protein
MIPNIVTTKEACKILKIGRTTLNNILLNDPTFPAVQAGEHCKWLINADRLDQWLMRKGGKY